MIKSKLINSGEYLGLPLLDNNGINGEFYEVILSKINGLLNDSLAQTSQCLVVRLDVRFPSTLNANSDNECFQYFIEEYVRSFGSALIRYIWVREQNTSHNQHYHIILFLDGNEVRYFKYPTQAVHLWSKALNNFYGREINATGLIQVCTGIYNGINMNHGIMIRRDDPAIQHEAFRICSYIAKTSTKGSAPRHVREFGSSIIKSNNQ